MTQILDYWEYQGETLCPRCGNDGTGRAFRVCAEYNRQGYVDAHALSCERYIWADDVCYLCIEDFALDEMGTTETPGPSL